MKYTGQYWMIIAPFMKKLLAKKYVRKVAREYIKKAKPIYRQMLAQAEDIGAKNPMAHNVYMSFAFMAIWKAADGAITPDDMRDMTRELLEMKIVRTVMGSGLDVNKPGDMDKLSGKFHKCAAWAEGHPKYRDKTWDFHFDDTLHKSGIYYHFTRCPLNDYARAYGYLEILPVMCELDYLLAGLYHARLYREQTLAGGGTVCDYWFVGDQEQKSFCGRKDVMNKRIWDIYAPIYEKAMRGDRKAYGLMYERIPQVIQGKDVLEVATGPGLLAKHVAHAAHKMIATDYSDGMIREAKKGSYPDNLTFEVADAEHLPYADNSYDAVIIANALHIVPNPQKALREIDRVLKTDGLLIAPNFVNHQKGVVSAIWSKIIRIAGVKLEHQWSTAEYRAFLEANGWKVVMLEEMPARITLAYAECMKQKKG